MPPFHYENTMKPYGRYAQQYLAALQVLQGYEPAYSQREAKQRHAMAVHLKALDQGNPVEVDSYVNRMLGRKPWHE